MCISVMSLDAIPSPSPSPSPTPGVEFDAAFGVDSCGAFYSAAVDRFERAALGLVLSTAAFSIGLCLVMVAMLVTTRRLSIAVDALKAESRSSEDSRAARKTLLVKDGARSGGSKADEAVDEL